MVGEALQRRLDGEPITASSPEPGIVSERSNRFIVVCTNTIIDQLFRVCLR